MARKPHEVPKCKRCKKFMALKNRLEPTEHEASTGISEYFVYYCDNPECGNQEEKIVPEYN